MSFNPATGLIFVRTVVDGVGADDSESPAPGKMERKEGNCNMKPSEIKNTFFAVLIFALALTLLMLVSWNEAHAQMMPPGCPVDANDIVLCHAVWLPIVANELIVTGDAR